MITLTEPIQAGDQIYLRDTCDSTVLWRHPQPPALFPGAVGGYLVKFRKPSDEHAPADEAAHMEDWAGGILSLAFDIGPIGPVAAADEVELNRQDSPPRNIWPLPVHGGSLKVFLFGSEILTAAVPSAIRPTVPCCAKISPSAATLLSKFAPESEQTDLIATCVLQVTVHYAGPRFTLEIDGDKSIALLGGTETAHKCADLRGQIERLVKGGTVRVIADATGTPEMRILSDLLAIGTLFEPMPGARSWSTIPGMGSPAVGVVRVSGSYGLPSRIEVKSGLAAPIEVEIPCFATAPVHLSKEVHEAVLPWSCVLCITTQLLNPDVRQVDFQLPDGTEATARFSRDDVQSRVCRTIRYVLPEDGSMTYRYRVDGGEWLSAEHLVLLIP